MPPEIRKRYEKWKDIATLSGPRGLRWIKGFHLRGIEWLLVRIQIVAPRLEISRDLSHPTGAVAISGGPNYAPRLQEDGLKTFRPAKQRMEVSPGESVRSLRELQAFSQNQLAQLTGIPQATLSAIENGRVRLGVERAKVRARALRCHPAVLVFPGWDVARNSAA